MSTRYAEIVVFGFKILGYLILLLEFLLLSFGIYCKCTIGRLLNVGSNPLDASENKAYYDFILILDNLFWEVVMIWLFAAVVYYFTIKQVDNNFKIGILGLLIAALYLFSDPFGLIQYLLD